MQIRENQTTVRGVVKQIVPGTDGYGHELDLEILDNQSASAADDYLKPKVGDRLKVFAADLEGLQVGASIQATLGLSGGPFGQRTVLKSAQRG